MTDENSDTRVGMCYWTVSFCWYKNKMTDENSDAVYVLLDCQFLLVQEQND